MLPPLVIVVIVSGSIGSENVTRMPVPVETPLAPSAGPEGSVSSAVGGTVSGKV